LENNIFTIRKEDQKSDARQGTVSTPHGEFQTPIFMPVGTQGSVKTTSPKELKDNGAQIILGNTYHLYLRPGHELIQKAGGLHKFVSWDRPMLTDSGGYQVFSLADLNKISEEGVKFQSHIDGSYHLFTPEKVMEIERALGADIAMVFDECTPYPCTYNYAKNSSDMTIRWAKRCKDHFHKIENPTNPGQLLFAINQGSVFEQLRWENANALVDMDFPGYAIGGLSVGEPKENMYEMIEVVNKVLPKEKPRYLMGVGYPEDIVEAVSRGVDMFDCVVPTRYGRNGTVFTHSGKLVIKNATYAEDFIPMEDGCECYACQNFSRAYIRHLFQVGEILAPRLATLHNIHFWMTFTKNMRKSIEDDNFEQWKKQFLNRYLNGGQ
jgi:queuine tRNA-ribosyltransferase